MLRLAQIWQDFHQARLSVARLGDILNTAPEPSYQSGRAALPAIRGDIDLRPRHVSLPHRRAGGAARRQLRTFRPGRWSASSAPRAPASRTLTKLVQRLYVPESGRVLVDGVDLAMVDRRLAAPPGRRGAAGERAVQPLGARQHRARRSRACRWSGWSRRRSSPARTSSFWSCRRATTRWSASAAHSLSGGQRQRIAIARALVDQSAHSDLRRGDQRARLRERAHHPGEHAPDRAGAHRADHRPPALDRARTADRIITIERGRIVEDGTHDELIRTGGRYATLHRMQAGLHEAV